MNLIDITTKFNLGDMVTLIHIDRCHHGCILKRYKVGRGLLQILAVSKSSWTAGPMQSEARCQSSQTFLQWGAIRAFVLLLFSFSYDGLYI